MNIKTLSQYCFYLLLFTQIILTGCTGLNTFPHIARGGDSILLAVGSADGMTKDNITVEYESDSNPGVRIDLSANVIGLFKLHPSKKSIVFLRETRSIANDGHEPWLTTMAINLPNSIPEGGILPIGTGKIYINCVPKASCVFPTGLFTELHLNGFGIALEILAGQGQANPFQYRVAPSFFGDSRDVTPLSMEEIAQVTVRPDVAASDPVAKYGAIEVKINAPIETDTGAAVPDSIIFVFAEDLAGLNNSQRNVNWKREGDVITVILTSPAGMVYQEARFSVVLRPPMHSFGTLTTGRNLFTVAPTLVPPAKFYDTNGNIIDATVSPTLNVSLDNANWLN